MTVFQTTSLLTWISLICIIIVGIGLRLSVLQLPMRYDESYTMVWFVAHGIPTIISDYSVPNNHIFHSLLVYLSVKLFGVSSLTIRLPALLAGIACIPVAFSVASKLYNQIVGLLAAGLVATSSVLIEYSVNARGYTLQCLLVLILIACTLDLRQSGHRLKAWRGYILTGIIGLYVLPTMAFSIAAACLWMLLATYRKPSALRRRFWLALIFAHFYIGIIAALLYLPVLMTFGLSAITSNPFVRPMTDGSFWSVLGIVLTQWVGLLTRALSLPIIVLLVSGVLTVCMPILRRRINPATSLLVVLFGVACCGILIQRNAGFARTWLYLIPPLFILASAGISSLIQRVSSQALPFALVIILMVSAVIVGNASVIASTEGGTCPLASIAAAQIERGESPDLNTTIPPCDAPIDYYRWVDQKAIIY